MEIYRYVLITITSFLLAACTLDASLSKLSRAPLSLTWDETNSAVNTNNVRSFTVKGICEIGSDVDLKIGSIIDTTLSCGTEGTFTSDFDLAGISEGSLLVIALQDAMTTNQSLSAQKNIPVDITPPTITFDVPDNATNFTLSSLKSNYPLSGTCSDPFSIVNITSTTNLNLMAICSAAGLWEVKLNLSSDDSSSIEFYAQHTDAAGNVSSTLSQSIRAGQWLKISPDITSAGVASVRQIVQLGDTGRIVTTVPLRNDDLVDLGVVNFDGTGLARINPSFGSWGVDTTKPLIASAKYNRAFYVIPVPGRAQLRELHSAKMDGSDDKVLMGATTENPVGGVTNFLLTPDQKTIVAIGDIGSIDNEFNLYAINVVTGAKIKLNGTMVLGGDVRDFVISPDSSEVVFRMDKDTDEAIDLYAVKIDGTNLRKLNASVSAGKAVQTGYTISPDGNWVSFRDNQNRPTSYDLYVTSLKTGERANLSSTATNGMYESLWSPDSKQILFRADPDLATCWGLYNYDVTAKTTNIVSNTCDSNVKDTYSYTWSPDSSKIAFSNTTTSARFDLFIANRDGSNKVQLMTAAANFTGANPVYKDNAIMISPDNQYVVFQGEIKGTANANSSAMRLNLYSVKSDGSGAPVLLHSVAGNTAARDFPIIRISPTSDRVAFAVDLDTDAKYEMFLSAIDGSTQLKISPAIPNPLGSVYVANAYQYFFDWAKDTVAMIIDENIDSVGTIYLGSLKLTASAAKNITLPLQLSGDVVNVTASKNKQKVFFRANPDADAEMHLYVADANGSNMRRLSNNYVSGGGVMRSYTPTADGSKVVYISDQETPGQEELYIVDTSAGTALKINVPLATDGDVVDFKIAEGSGKVFYRAGVTSSTHTDIYSVNFDGTGSAKITPNYQAAGVISSWDLSPDETFLTFRGDFYSDEIFEVVTLPAAGGAFTRVHTAHTGGFDSFDFAISPDSNWVCSRGEYNVDGQLDVQVKNMTTTTVYPVATAVSAAQGALACSFTPDSVYVVITGDWNTDGKTMLQTFRLSDQTLTALNPSLPLTSHTSSFAYVNIAGAKRIIALSESSPEFYEVYSMNFDGSDLRKISQAPYAGGTVNANQGQAMQVLDDADGTIVYSGLIDTVGKWDLYAVKWDGSSSRKLLTLNNFADIYDFSVSEGSTNILFRADNDKDGVLNMYSIKLDGTGLKNHTPGLAFGTTASAGYVETTSHVIFRSDAYRGQLYELFADAL